MKLPEKILYAHEHTTIDLSGPKKNIDCRLDDFDATAAEYRRLAEHGVVGIIDQTNRGMGRNVAYVQKMAAQAGGEITHATGYYKEPFLPPECYTLTEQQLCDIMVKELTEGMEGTGVRATVIGEIGTSKDITETEAKVFRAASRAHAETGAPICTHTTLGTRGLEQLEIFKSFGVDLSRVVLSHIDLSANLDYMKRLLDQGVNIAFDTIGKCNYQPDVSRADWLSRLCAEGYDTQIVMSMDITRRSKIYFLPAGLPLGLCLLLTAVSRTTLPTLTLPLLVPDLFFAALLAAAYVGYRREGAWMQDDHLTLRRQKGFHLHCVCALHPDLCLTVQQSPWAVAAHRANLTLIFPGRLKQKVRSVALTELAFLQQAER